MVGIYKSLTDNMNVDMGYEVAQFHSWEYIFQIFGTVQKLWILPIISPQNFTTNKKKTYPIVNMRIRQSFVLP
jgi:hypothetical protein